MAKQTLAKQTGTLAMEGFKLPEVFGAPAQPLISKFQTPYLTFAHPKRADEWAKLPSNVQEGDMFLVLPTGPVALPTAKLSLVCCKQYWGQANPAGELLSTSFQEQPHPYKEHIESVVLVYFEDRVVPANALFRTTKCPAANTLNAALLEAATPAWADRSPEHRETLAVAQPFFRFYGLVTLGPQRTSKTSGLTYRPTTCKIHPTSISEWRLLNDFSSAEGTQKALDDVAQRFQDRLAGVQKKLIQAA